jgi:hypothetical protein
MLTLPGTDILFESFGQILYEGRKIISSVTSVSSVTSDERPLLLLDQDLHNLTQQLLQHDKADCRTTDRAYRTYMIYTHIDMR